jgi:predicted RNA binding protein YcfA (HicA-like mRNA interferase family)
VRSSGVTGDFYYRRETRSKIRIKIVDTTSNTCYNTYIGGEQVVNLPNESREVRKIIEADGWEFHSQSGSHCQFVHNIKLGKVTIPHAYRKYELPKGTVRSILKQEGYFSPCTL